MSTQNPEDIVKQLMSELLKGNAEATQTFLKQKVDPGLLRFVLDQLRVMGNNAVRAGNYEEAILCYDQALAGSDSAEEKAALLSNKSVALAQANRLPESLEAARSAIAFRPDWEKGWIRAARIFEKQQQFVTALTLLKAAQRRAPHSPELARAIAHLEPAAAKEKALERISTDYSRFEKLIDAEAADIEADAQNNPVNGDDAGSGTCAQLEFNEHVTPEQRRHLQALLAGGDNPTLVEAPEASHPHLLFDPETLKVTAKRRTSQKRTKSVLHSSQKGGPQWTQICVGLKHLLHVQSELAVPRRIVRTQLLNTSGTQSLTATVNSVRIVGEQLAKIGTPNLEPNGYAEENTARKPAVVWLFLGLGTSLPLAAACLLPAIPKPHCIIACTHQMLPFVAWMADRILGLNECIVSEDDTPNGGEEKTPLMPASDRVTTTGHCLHMVPKRLEQLTIPEGCDTGNVHPLDTAVADLPHGRASVLVVDQELFDVTGVSRHALPTIRDARKRLCSLQTPPIVVPSRMRLLVYAAVAGVRRFPQADMDPRFNDRALNAARWSAVWEPLDAFSLSTEPESPGRCRRITELACVYEAVFDGPLDQLESDIPYDTTFSGHLVPLEDGTLNAIVVFAEFSFPTMVENATDSSSCRSSAPSSPMENWVLGAAGHGARWITPVRCRKGETLAFEGKVAPSAFHFRLLPVPHDDDASSVPNSLCAWALPRTSFNPIDFDPALLADIQDVLTGVVTSAVHERSTALERGGSYLSRQTKQHVEVLLFDSTCGILAAAALRAAATVFEPKALLPVPTFHLTAVEMSRAHAAVSRLYINDNAVLLTEDANLYHAALAGQKKWIPLGHKAPDSCPESAVESVELPSEVQQKIRDKLKLRLSILAKDPRSLRPPTGTENGIQKMALYRFLQRAPGTPLPPSVPSDHLNAPADIVLNQMVDCGLLGDGILPIMRYATAALTKTRKKMIPARASVYAAGIGLATGRLAPSDPHYPELHAEPWTKLLCPRVEDVFFDHYPPTAPPPNGYTAEYFPINLDSSHYVLMTHPICVFEFDFERQHDLPPPVAGPFLTPMPLDAKGTVSPGAERCVQLDLPALQDGIVQAVVFWYDLYFESHNTNGAPRGYTTEPATLQSAWSSPPEVSLSRKGLRRLTHPVQACQMLDCELAFKRDDTVTLQIWHNRSTLHARWGFKNLTEFFLRNCSETTVLKVDGLDIAWTECARRHSLTLDKLMALLLASPQEISTVASVVGELIQDHGKTDIQDLALPSFTALDVEEVAWFLLSFFC